MVIVYTKSDLANSTNLKLQVFEENSVVSDSKRGESLPLAPAAGASSATPSNGGHPRNAPVVQISSKNGNGLKNLFDEVSKILTAGLTTERQQAGLGSARQKDAVAEALECTKHALVSADDNYTLDAVVQDLEDALDAVSEVTGDVTPDDVLGSIFANFCVGK